MTTQSEVPEGYPHPPGQSIGVGEAGGFVDGSFHRLRTVRAKKAWVSHVPKLILINTNIPHFWSGSESVVSPKVFLIDLIPAPVLKANDEAEVAMVVNKEQ